MKRYCFPDEATSLSLLNEAGYMVQDYVKDEDGNDVADGDPHFPHNMKGQGFDIMVIGTISKPTGETEQDADGNDVPVMAALDGWHVDILTRNVPECLEQYLVVPNNPVHVV